MATTTIEAQCNARPTRLAFILSKPDREQLKAVFARASTLWGGVFDPIVILDGATRRTAGVHYTTYPGDPYPKLQADLLKAFDPDLLITYSEDDLPRELMAWKHRCFPSSNLDWNPFGRNVQSYFVDIFPPLHDLWEREFKGFDNPRFKVKYIEKAEAEKSLLLAARFGLYSSSDYYEFLQRNFRAEPFVYDATFRSTHWPADFQTILGLTAHSCGPPRQRIHSHAFFLLDPEDPFDVVDYWNLRAAGMYVLPLTLSTYQECAIPIQDFAAVSSYPINETVTNMPSIIKAASITDQQQQEVTRWIGERNLAKGISMQGWVPHYHDGGYGVANELDIEPVTGVERNAVGVLVDGHGKIEGPAPPFLTRDNYSEHWSMDLDFFNFRMPDACYDMPWLNSGCDALAGRKIGMGFGMDVARVSSDGLVARLDGNSGDVRISPIRAEDVVKAFLDGTGIEYVDTSSPGLALKRIIEMMDGFYSCEMFQNAAIRQTLEELATGDQRLVRVVRRMVMESLRAYRRFGRPATQQQKGQQSDRLLAQAVDAGVFRVGLVFQCSKCRRHHWYGITEFGTQYNCKSCFSREHTPHLDTTEWYYASDGLFRSTNKLDGNITVLLALAFFNELLDHDLRFAPSFDYKLDGSPHEMDFAVLARERFRGKVEMIFGESKSELSLTQDERQKLRSFGKQTDSYICFCTLAEDFSADDKAYFMELYDSGVKVILLPRLFLEMDAHDASRFESDHRRAFGSSKADWLMRTTIIGTLGEDFAKKHHIWA
ncbi:MAG: hypothetical protein WB555_10290 [Candidatus Korobacteraceae bacterium]